MRSQLQTDQTIQEQFVLANLTNVDQTTENDRNDLQDERADPKSDLRTLRKIKSKFNSGRIEFGAANANKRKDGFGRLIESRLLKLMQMKRE
jgi:hypothetical protein